MSSLSADRRGAILSLMDGRRVRVVSGQARRRGRIEGRSEGRSEGKSEGKSEGRRPPSPPTEQENPFIREMQIYKTTKQTISIPSRKILDKV